MVNTYVTDSPTKVGSKPNEKRDNLYQFIPNNKYLCLTELIVTKK